MKKNNIFNLDINWIAGQAPGTSRDTTFHFPALNFDPDLTLKDFVGTVTVTIIEDGIILHGDLNAKVKLECTRCLCTFLQQIEINFDETYSLSRSKEELGIAEQPFPPDGHIDLEPVFREYTLIEVPIKHICSEDCKGLCPVCGSNLNEEDCGHKQEKIDPRMAVLGQFLDKEE